MIRLFLLIVLFCSGSNCFSQGTSPSDSPGNSSPKYSILRSNLGVSGSSNGIVTAEGNYTIDQSIGQASVIGTNSTSIITLLQGYQQSSSSIEAPTIENLKENVLRVIIGPILLVHGLMSYSRDNHGRDRDSPNRF